MRGYQPCKECASPPAASTPATYTANTTVDSRKARMPMIAKPGTPMSHGAQGLWSRVHLHVSTRVHSRACETALRPRALHDTAYNCVLHAAFPSWELPCLVRLCPTRLIEKHYLLAIWTPSSRVPTRSRASRCQTQLSLVLCIPDTYGTANR